MAYGIYILDLHVYTIQLLNKPASCSLDPIPTHILKDNLNIMLPVMTKMVNSSLTDGEFYPVWKIVVVTPLPKKQGFDLVMSNYIPICF